MNASPFRSAVARFDELANLNPEQFAKTDRQERDEGDPQEPALYLFAKQTDFVLRLLIIYLVDSICRVSLQHMTNRALQKRTH
jgi:hypothetical protein